MVIWISPGKQKKVYLLQIEVALTEYDYISVHGPLPAAERWRPFRYTAMDTGVVYNGTWESFYLYSPNLHDLMQLGRQSKLSIAPTVTDEPAVKKRKKPIVEK